MRHELDSNNSGAIGEQAESNFIITLVRHGYSIKRIRKARRDEERQHVDVVVDNTVKYEVKSMKRIRREGEQQDDFVWIELTNWLGYQGWLFGSADKVAFETAKGFLVVALSELQYLISQRVKWITVDRPEDAVYKIYHQRKQAKVELTLVPRADIEAIAEGIL